MINAVLFYMLFWKKRVFKKGTDNLLQTLNTLMLADVHKCHRPLISAKINRQSLNIRMFTPSGCKDIGIRKLEFETSSVPSNQFSIKKLYK